MKTNTTLILVLVIALFILIAAKVPKKVIEPKQTLCFVCPNAENVKVYVDNYTKQGFTVKEIACQTVATSINTRSNSSSAYCSPQRDLYGKFVLILEK